MTTLHVFAAAALFAAISQAQVIQPGGGGGGTLTCSVLNTGNPTQIRAEGRRELLGDVVISCNGGVHASPVPTVNITVALNNALVTSRVFADGLSEALLLIDEPGAGSGVGAGGTLPQTLCTGGALGAASGGCETQPGTVGSYTGAVLKTNTSVVPNVFQGVITANQVVFNGIPLLAPVTAGAARVFRITNLRVDASALAAPQLQGQVPVLASVSLSGGVPATNPVQTLGFLFNGFNSATQSVRNAANTAAGSSITLAGCAVNPLTPGAVLRFAEGFAAAFKSRIARTASLSGAATLPNSLAVVPHSTVVQNTPAQILPGSESAFVVPVPGGTAGLADFGTRLKATFRNVPPGVNLYVSVTNINPLGNSGVNPATAANLGALANAVAAGNFGGANTFLAALVSNESAVAAEGSPLPLVAATTTAGGVPLLGPLPVDGNGTASAVWEILNLRENFPDSAEFAVFYTSNGATPVASPIGTVSMGYGSGFVDPSTATNLITILPCAAMSISSSANPSSHRQSVTFTASVSGTAPLPSTVTFTDGGATLGTAPVASGQATFTTNALSLGAHTIAAVSGAISSPTLTQTVNRAATTTVLSAPASLTPGQTATFTATVTGAFGGTPTGPVTFRNGATSIGSALLNSSGTATLSTALPIGSHTVTAAYTGDSNYLASASSAATTTINARSTSVSTPAVTSGTPAPGQPITLSATVSGDGSLTGMLTFTDNGTTLGAAAIDPSGTASIAAMLAAGAHSIVASYSGDVFNSASTSAPLFLNLRTGSTVTLRSSLNPATPDAALTFTATVAAASGSAVPTGSVTFTNGSSVIGTATLNASAQAVLTLAAGLAAGSHNIAASYAGDTNLQPSTSATLVQAVVRIVTTTSLAEAASADGFTVTAVVSAESGTPTGAVHFRDLTANTTMAGAALVNGVASIGLRAPLPIGHTIQAVYDGDTAFAGSSSTPQPFIAAANGFSFALNFAPDSIVSIFGADLAPATAAGSLPLPTTLGGIEVRLVDPSGRQYPAMLYYVSPGQINFVVPPAVPLGPARLLIVRGNEALSLSITIARAAPSLTSADGSGSGTAAAQIIRLRRDGTQDSPVSVSASAIAFGGDRLFLVLYGTGLRHASGQLACTMNGQTVPVLFAGAHTSYPGLDQVNVEIPSALRGLISVACSTQSASTNTVTLTVQ